MENLNLGQDVANYREIRLDSGQKLIPYSKL